MGIHAVAVNQYREARFNTCVYDGVDYCAQYGIQMGEDMLSLYGVPAERYWLWYRVIFLFATYIFFMALSCLVLEYWRYETPEIISLSAELGDVENNSDSTSANYSRIATPKATNDQSMSIPVTQTDRAFVPVTLAFKDLWYSVPDPSGSKASIDLLKGISGYALPGTITALMGSSGAGKTTLMDVIAGRKTADQITGSVLLNGNPATEIAVRPATGYCEQMDIHSEASRFRDALTFSAFLRQDAAVSDSEKYDCVNECLELLDLHSIADRIIRGSSTQQMKRLTIDVELAAQPSVLFLDEPTTNLSGLAILQAYFGQLLAYLCPKLEVASILVILINYIWTTFTDFNSPTASIPRGYRWLYHLTLHKYTHASPIAIVFGDCPSGSNDSELGCQQMIGAPPTLGSDITVAEYLDRIFSARQCEIWQNFGIILLWITCLRFVSLLALRFVNQKK
ncbi:hypothetical protein PC116_g22349 [Phytophthora cactorum]|nr:hypothetical protein PC114_g19950 [Phytophthora cactorum]KAG2988917.1 hypothetical protein PC119_g19433 [Phytophthora cactorum]KAG4229321.1 hypothetical protein PC116_g22349 [Phytophthora cactorum]